MNIDYNSEESYIVNFDGSDTTIEGILSLKTTDFQNKKPGIFAIDPLEFNWNDGVLKAFCDVLYYFKERGIQWNRFKLCFCSRDQPFTSVLLQTVNRLNIFKKMNLYLHFNDDDDQYSADCEYLFPGINQNKQLEALEVGICGDHPDRFENDFTAFASHLREMTTLKKLILSHFTHINEQAFSEAFSENKSLENLLLDFRCCNGNADEKISNIVTSLASHPKLEFLQIGTKDQFGDLSSRALQKLLSKTQTLSELRLYNEGSNGGLNAEYIVQGLKKNQSLKFLTTSDSFYGDLVLSRFFQILPHCPKLEYLGLLENVITASDSDQVIHMDRLQKPIILRIRNDVIRNNVAVMANLLRCHPEVRLTVHNPLYVFDDNVELKHICELNWNGRYLIDESTRVPLSLWPIVFERVNDKQRIIYEFLKGPCFAANK